MVIGIDPGKSGSITDGTRCWRITSVDDIVNAFEEIKLTHHELPFIGQDIIIYIEAVHSSPQMGVVSAFSFGQNFGQLQAMCHMIGDRVEYVSPQKWQKYLGLSRGISKCTPTVHKRRLKDKAIELFPKIKVTGYNQDALLLYHYGKLMEANNG